PPGKLPAAGIAGPLLVCRLTYVLPVFIALTRSDSGCPASGRTRLAAVIVPSAITPSILPPLIGPGVVAVDGYSQTTIGPFAPGWFMWMWAMNTLSMFAAMSLYSSALPSLERWKIACAWPFVSCGGTSFAPFACTLQFPLRPATAAPTRTKPTTATTPTMRVRIPPPSFGGGRADLRGERSVGLHARNDGQPERRRASAVDHAVVEGDCDRSRSPDDDLAVPHDGPGRHTADA